MVKSSGLRPNKFEISSLAKQAFTNSASVISPSWLASILAKVCWMISSPVSLPSLLTSTLAKIFAGITAEILRQVKVAFCNQFVMK